MSRIILILFIFSGGVVQFFGQSSTTPLTKCWEILSDDLRGTQNASDNTQDNVLLQNNEKIISINNLGKINWELDLEGNLLSKFLITNNKIYLATQNVENTDKFYIHELSIETGLTIKKREIITQKKIRSILLVPYFENLIAVVNNESFYLIDRDNGTLFDEIGNRITSNIEIKENLIIFVNDLNQIIEYDISKKVANIIFKSSKEINKIFVGNKNEILFADKLGSLFFLNKDLAKIIWKYRTGGDINTITKTENGFLVSSFDNYVYYFQKDVGKLLWKKRLEARNSGALSQKTNQYILSLNNGQIAFVLDLEKGKIINQINLEENSFFVNSPVMLQDSVIFSTNKGILSYGIKGC